MEFTEGKDDIEEQHASWKASKPAEQLIQNPESSLNVLDTIKAKLEALYQDNILYMHQTASDTAEQILNTDYFGHNGLEGTAALVSPEQAIIVFPQLDKNAGLTQGERTVATHKGATGAVILVLPRDLAQRIGEESDIGKFSTSVLDDYLADKFSAGEIRKIGLPNQFIYGYYSHGNFVENPKFNPSF